jgi:SAM-dependent methyltransferase
MASATPEEMQAYYARGEEADRLARPNGIVEFERTKEIILRALPPAPAVVADIGGGPGRYAEWLAGLGYDVEHRDLVESHVAHVATMGNRRLRSAVGDARGLDLATASVDVVLLLGPLYHLPERADRVAALREAGRILKPGGVVFAAVISRWAPRLDGWVAAELSLVYPDMPRLVDHVEATGDLLVLHDASFCGYTHRPDELAAEVRDAGLELTDLVGVEGIAFALNDLDERLADPARRAIVLDNARDIERVPELMGLSPHLVATAHRA